MVLRFSHSELCVCVCVCEDSDERMHILQVILITFIVGSWGINSPTVRVGSGEYIIIKY